MTTGSLPETLPPKPEVGADPNRLPAAGGWPNEPPNAGAGATF